MATQGVQNATFDENPHENERIVVILGCANSIIACAKHRWAGGWLKLCSKYIAMRRYKSTIFPRRLRLQQAEMIFSSVSNTDTVQIQFIQELCNH